MRRYATSVQIYSSYQRVVPDRLCNGFLVENKGTTFLYCNNSLILPGANKSFGGNQDEIFSGYIELKFVTQSPPPGTVTNYAEVTQKYFIEYQQFS